MNRSKAEQQLDLHLKKAAEASPPMSAATRARLDAAYASLPDRPAADSSVREAALPSPTKRRSSALRRTVVIAASALTISGSLFSKIKGDDGLRTAGERNQGIPFEATAESGDMTMTVKETIFDGTRVAFAVDLTLPQIRTVRQLDEQMQNVSLRIDGGRELNGFFYNEPEDQGNGTFSLLMNKPLDPDDAQGLGERFEGRITVTMRDQAQPLTVSVPFERIKSDRELHLNPGPEIEDDTYTLKIDTLDVTASTVRLGTTLRLKNLSASAAQQDEALSDIRYEIVDDQGNPLDIVDGQSMQDGGTMTGSSNYGADLGEAAYIVVKPYLNASENNKDLNTYLKSLEIKIDLNPGD